MKILHYSLGLPPYRSGGLTKFCTDMMIYQMKSGHEVFLLWPGEMSLYSETVKIKQHRKYIGIHNFEVINPLPISYDEGIVDIRYFIKDGPIEPFTSFLGSIKPDVIHVHTLMGLHKSFLMEANRLGIKIIFTTHDFFPLCSKVTMFRNGGVCPTVESCIDCPKCNMTALSISSIMLLQSSIYRSLKDNILIKKARKRHRNSFLEEKQKVREEIPKTCSDDYRVLRSHYMSMLALIDVIHFNSTITEAVYSKYCTFRNSKVITITHANIRDNRKVKKYDIQHTGLRITYLGPQSSVKGFFILKDALDIVYERRCFLEGFELNVFFHPIISAPYFKEHDRYDYDQLEDIFNKTDILVAPSLWYETFGFTVIEALSFGVPVIISETVGAKDIVSSDTGIIIKNITPKKLAEEICSLNDVKLSQMNLAILEKTSIMTIETLCKTIEKECYLRETVENGYS